MDHNIDQIIASLRHSEASKASTEVPSQYKCSCETEICEDPEHCKSAVAHHPKLVETFIKNGACRISSTLGISPAHEAVAGMIDHTLLKPDATQEEIDELCHEAKTYCFASVCVNPGWVKRCSANLRQSGVRVCTVVGFPLGATLTRIKALEAEMAVDLGAHEVDMVINIGWLKSGLYSEVKRDIIEVVKHSGAATPVKVILETALLNDEEKIKACVLAKQAGAAFVKTSTGFSKGGANLEDVALMRYVVGKNLGVKASGGVRSYDDALKMVAAGATRIGASASVKIVSGKEAIPTGNY